MLSHIAGSTVHGFPGYGTSVPLPTTVQVLNGEPPANTAKVEVNIIPGLHHRYSGGGTTIAQQVLVDVLGKPFPEIMRELVLGVPVTIKDIFETAGLRTTAGYIPLKDYVPQQDATVVARLRAAGAVIFGKTNMAELAGDFQSTNSLFPRVNNLVVSMQSSLLPLVLVVRLHYIRVEMVKQGYLLVSSIKLPQGYLRDIALRSSVK